MANRKPDPAANAPLTRHGRKRWKQRCGLDAKALSRTAAKALRIGLGGDDMKGVLKTWFQACEKSRPGYIQRIHGNHIFIFGADKVLVTVLELPHEHRKAVAEAVKRKGGAA